MSVGAEASIDRFAKRQGRRRRMMLPQAAKLARPDGSSGA
jgi:hypothetical protein